jgi:hypothetical protein
VRVAAANDAARITVEGRGQGIALADRERIFKFYRANPHLAHAPGRSSQLGAGATFMVEFPVARRGLSSAGSVTNLTQGV